MVEPGDLIVAGSHGLFDMVRGSDRCPHAVHPHLAHTWIHVPYQNNLPLITLYYTQVWFHGPTSSNLRSELFQLYESGPARTPAAGLANQVRV